VPVKATVVGLFVALLVTTTEAVRAPAADGLKVIVTWQLAPTARLLGQLSLVGVKSPLLVPVIVPLASVSAAAPLLVNVSVSGALVVPTAWFPNDSGLGVIVRTGPPATPDPVRLTVWGLPVALSVMLTDAVRDPVEVGLNVTLMVHFAPAPTLVPHVFVRAKSPLLVPVRAMLAIVSVALPVLVSVTTRAVLVVPTV
jgi:hypothetical protein